MCVDDKIWECMWDWMCLTHSYLVLFIAKRGFRIYVCHSPGFRLYTMGQIARLNTSFRHRANSTRESHTRIDKYRNVP